MSSLPKKFCVNCFEELNNPKFMYCFDCNKPENKENYERCKGISKNGEPCKLLVYFNYCVYHKSQGYFKDKRPRFLEDNK